MDRGRVSADAVGCVDLHSAVSGDAAPYAGVLLLVAQPLAIRTRRIALHRTLARASYVIAPLVLVSMVLLTHSKTHGAATEDLVGPYVPLSLAALFALS